LLGQIVFLIAQNDAGPLGQNHAVLQDESELQKKVGEGMQERLVDVLNAVGNVIHTYPITLPGADLTTEETLFEAKALEAACFGRLVADEELSTLRARMHIARSGPLEPYGDDVPVMSETRSALVNCIREYAYFLWKNHEGAPRSAAEDWSQARQRLLEERAYTLWEEDGRPANRADEYWFRTKQFESC
jgi:hypothetical protein